MDGKRKVWIIGGVLVMAFVLTLVGKMAGAEFVTVATVAVGAFAAANAVEHWKKGETNAGH